MIDKGDQQHTSMLLRSERSKRNRQLYTTSTPELQSTLLQVLYTTHTSVSLSGVSWTQKNGKWIGVVTDENGVEYHSRNQEGLFEKSTNAGKFICRDPMTGKWACVDFRQTELHRLKYVAASEYEKAELLMVTNAVHVCSGREVELSCRGRLFCSMKVNGDEYFEVDDAGIYMSDACEFITKDSWSCGDKWYRIHFKT